MKRSSSTPETARLTKRLRRSIGAVAAGIAFILLPAGVGAQELLYQEGFNTDGEKATPPRYTTLGREVYELDRQSSELNLTSQAGPIYWAHNFDVKSYVGIPAPTSGRRAVLTWDLTIAAGDVTENGFKLVESTVKWLAANKAGAKILFSPSSATAQALADRLGGAGYSVLDDDETQAETAFAPDVIVKCAGNTNPSRWAKSAKGVLIISGLDSDDMQFSTIGSTGSFEAGNVSIAASSHPAAGGLSGSFPAVSGLHTAWQLPGTTLPGDAIVVATTVRNNPPSAASLAEVDAMVAGTTPNTKTTASVDALDFSDASAGNYAIDNPIPGGATGVFGLVCTGKLKVTKAGKYSFALGVDDGARLRIDAGKDGFTDADNVIVENVAGAHRVLFGDATFAAAGSYDFQVTMFNSGGGGDVELSVSTQTGGADTNAIDGGTWELLGQTTGAVGLDGTIAAASYVPTQTVQESVPFLVLLNGPQDSPPGSVYGGGPISGQEGAGFFCASGINKWPYPDGAPYYNGDAASGIQFRTLRLRPVDVTGKKNVQVTIALAASFQDFETDDHLLLLADPDGSGPQPAQVLADFSAPDGNTKYFVDVKNGKTNRLGLKFIDCTYKVPDGATQLAIEVWAKTTWWNEIAAFDNIRITAGESALVPVNMAAAREGANVRLSWTGGNGPFTVLATTNLTGAPWAISATTSERSLTLPATNTARFFKVQDR
jgi:hypothetical protein